MKATWKEVAVFCAECAVVAATTISLLALGAILDTI